MSINVTHPFATHGDIGTRQCEACRKKYVPIRSSDRMPVCGKCLAEFKIFVRSNNKTKLLDRYDF